MTASSSVETLFPFRVRPASHAGSWYSDCASELAEEVDGYISAAEAAGGAAASSVVVSPHAGYAYCGRTMGYSYAALSAHLRGRECPTVVVVGPSHHEYFEGCALTRFRAWATPLGAVEVDAAAAQRLVAAAGPELFAQVPPETEVEEHSLEMMLPFLCRCAARAGCRAVRIVPVMVSHLSRARCARLGAALAAEPLLPLVVSSDFCHWGARFGYTHLPPRTQPAESISSRIARLDADAARAIAKGPAAFAAYIDDTGNTICGRTPILAALHRVAATGEGPARGIFYDQSSHDVRSTMGSSVSYSSIIFAPLVPTTQK